MSAPTYTRQVTTWTNNVSAITATIMQNIENFLVNVSSWLQNTISDANITSDGLGNLTLKKVKLPTGSISRVSIFTAAVGTTQANFAHGLGVVPDMVFCQVTGGVSTLRTVCWNDLASDATYAALTGSSSFNCTCIAIKF